MTSLSKPYLAIGDRITIPDNGFGYPVREYDLKSRKYTDNLQVFEVEAITDGSIKLKPVWE